MVLCALGIPGGDETDIEKRKKRETEGIKKEINRTAIVLGGTVFADGGICVCLVAGVLSLSGKVGKG